MTLQDTIKGWISDTLALERDANFVVEYPGDFSHGDFAVNVAMVEAKQQKKNPKALAEEYAEKLRNNILPEVASVEVAGPGFINLKLKKEVFGEVVEKIVKSGPHFGNKTHFSGKRVIIEYTQPNPFKEFHVGHMMNNVIGESVSRIIEAHGTEVARATYHGDVGLHIAMAIYGLQAMEAGTDIDVKTLGQAYALGAKVFESDDIAKSEIIALNKVIYEKSDEEVNKLYEIGFHVSIHYFESIYKRLGSVFNYHFFESESAPIGMKIVDEYLQKHVFELSEKAIIFRGEQYGLHTRVFVSSEGLPMYETKELGLIKIKKDLVDPIDLSITVTANEQDSFFNVVEKAIEVIFPDMNGKLHHLSHGMLKLATGKMSSRTGNVVTAVWMIDHVKEAARMRIHERILSDKQREEISEQVALAALKYSILRQSIGGDVVFDIDKALSLEGDSGPYLQYATVRAQTLLRKAEGLIEIKCDVPQDWQTTNLERLLQRFPRTVNRAGKEYAPHYIVTYLTELAGEFNSFYASHKIIEEGNATSGYRLAITNAFLEVMKSGLHLLGIEVPEEM